MMHPSRLRVALATCRELPEPDPDQGLLLEALSAAGLTADMLPWDDGRATAAPFRTLGPDEYDLCVIRSTWNYHLDPARFSAWLDQVAAVTTLLNPRSVVHWNLHKRYLAELAGHDVPVIPTAWNNRGRPESVQAILAAHNWSDVVIKPAISAGSYRTRRFRSSDLRDAQRFLESLARDGDVMIQKYLPAIESGAERSLIWIDGALTHAVHKAPRFCDGDEQVSVAEPPTERERRFCTRVLALVPGGDDLLYARLDLIPDDAGTPCLSELELIEPSLFFQQYPPALARFVRAIRRRLQP